MTYTDKTNSVDWLKKDHGIMVAQAVNLATQTALKRYIDADTGLANNDSLKAKIELYTDMFVDILESKKAEHWDKKTQNAKAEAQRIMADKIDEV